MYLDPAARAKRFPPPEALSSSQKAAYTGKLVWFLGKAVCQKLFPGKPVTSVVQKQLSYKLLRNIMLNKVNSGQLGVLFKPMAVNYEKYCKKTKQPVLIASLDHNTKALWFGKDSPTNADSKVLFYLHGGGYAMAGGHDGHWALVESLMEKGKAKGIDVSTAFLAYDLTHHKPYPQQLIQAAVMLNYLLNDKGWKPNQIVLIGESAGGNLIFSLLLHILQPCPYVPVEIKLPENEPLAMAISLSPWTNMNLRLKSPEEYRVDPNNPDYLNPLMLDEFTLAFISTLEPDMDLRWANLVDTPKEWWDGLGNICADVLVTGGTEEIFAPDIVEFGSVLAETQEVPQKGGKAAKVQVIMETGVHAEPAVSLGAKKEEVPLWMRLLDWFGERI